MAFADPIKPRRTNTDPVGPLGCINKVTCGPKLFHSMPALLVDGKGCCGHLSGPLYTQLGRLCLRALLPPPPPFTPTHPLICGIRDIAVCVQDISQN